MAARALAAPAWQPLPRGVFTGIDWTRPDALPGVDPYLAWAEADRFRQHGLAQPPRWLPMLLELAPGTSVARLRGRGSARWLHIPPVYDGPSAPPGLRHCTARVAPAFFEHLAPGGRLHGHIVRCELGLPVAGQALGPTASGASRAGPGALLAGPVMALVDGPLAVAHAQFLGADGRTRIRRFWRQEEAGPGAVPQALGYGRELLGAEIDRARAAHRFGGLVDEGRLYRQWGFGLALERRASHGTHVLDIAAGAGRGDAAGASDIVAVQLDGTTVRDTSGGSMNVQILDALMYVVASCTPEAPITANVSWGTVAGPHDGSAGLEAAMDALVGLLGGRLRIVLPAGNSYQERLHATATLAPHGRSTLAWQVPPDDATPSFMEVWLPPGAHGVAVQLTPPGQPPLPAVATGGAGHWALPDGRSLCCVVVPPHVATGRNGTCALVALAPTALRGAAAAPAGTWQVTLANHGENLVTFDAYIERDDAMGGWRTGARQSRFADARYDLSGDLRAWIDQPDNPTPVRRSGSFNSIATGRHTLAVGALRSDVPHWARYSPRQPDPDAERPARDGVVKTPDTQAPCDTHAALAGVRAAGTRSGSTVRLVGTSAAAPQVVRALLNGMPR